MRSKLFLLITDKGFSIIEVVVGVAVFMVGMLGVSALLVSSVNGKAFSGNLTEATTLAASKMEVLMGLPLSHLDLLDADGDGNSGLNDKCVNSLDDGCLDADQADGCQGCGSDTDGVGRNKLYRVFWNISPQDPQDGLITMNVIVKWEFKGVERTIAFGGIRSGVI